MDSKTYAFNKYGDGQEVLATVHFDTGDKEAPKAIAVEFHGGGFCVGSRLMIPESQVNALAKLGFVVVAADYRLCPNVSLWDGPIADARAVYSWSREKLPELLKQDAGLHVDPDKVVALGHSAGGLLALHLGTLSPPVKAIVDFYGTKRLDDKFWVEPLPKLAQLPEFDKAFLDQVFDEGVLTSSATSMEKPSKGDQGGGSKGARPQQDLSKPRNAWTFDNLKRGTLLEKLVQDGDYARVDPATAFSKHFPPTYFVHGAADDLIIPRISISACELLQQRGGTGKVQLVDGESHGFDGALAEDDPLFKSSVKPALEFLAAHV